MRIRTWCVAAALLSLSVPVTAQTVLTEPEALARLSADSPRVRAIRAGVDVARADVLAADRWPNPRAIWDRESVSGVTETIVTVTQPLPITGRRGLEVSAANALVTASERRAEDAIRLARGELRSTYATLVWAQTRVRQLTQARDQVHELADVLARRENAGDAAGYDRLRAEREVMELDTQLADARADRVTAQTSLATFLGPGTDATALVAAAPPPTPVRVPLPPLDELVSRARATRGEVGALEQELASAQFAERAAGRRAIPEPEITAGTKSSNVGDGDVGGVISVQASIPLFDRGNPERAQARARAARAEAEAASLHVRLAAEVAGARAMVAERRDVADRYRATAAAAAELERIARVSYDAGERGILELLDAYRSGETARTRQAQLDAAVRQAEIELELLSGWEMQ
jgi:cobalt-zinc-cadmium efflux system outer membrane protein